MSAKKRGIALFVLLLLLVLSAVSGISESYYYADISVDVQPDGSVILSGTTNHPAILPGETDAFTSKKGPYWLLNISLKDSFSDFVFQLKLPDGAAINFVKAPSQVRISEEDGRLTITGTGKEEPFSVAVQYTIESSPPQNLAGELLLWFGPALLLMLIGLALLLIGNKKRSQPTSLSTSVEGSSYNPDTLTDRQRQIVDLITSSKTPLTQASIERSIKIPKSSISRNIDSLVRKGIIKKERRGMSNILTLIK